MFLCTALLAAAAHAQRKDLYDPTVFRTFHLTFAQKDWWDQLLKNKRLEIYIPADLHVDGRRYPNVGVRMRGGASFRGPRNLSSKKMPFKISMDEFREDQDLLGYSKLNLGNGYWDPSFLREVLAMRMMREFLPAPKANFVKLVINNESWGVYVNIQPPDSGFVAEHFRNTTGNRYKGQSTFKYYGPTAKDYSWPIQLKSKPGPTAYVDLISALSTTVVPLPQRVVELPKQIDVDMAHRHLAVNVATGNTDSTPKHNYYLYTDPYHKQLHIIPWDVNVSFRDVTSGYHIKPRLFGETDLWQRRYEGHLRNIVERLLDWNVLSKWAIAWHNQIDAEVRADTKKLYPYADFKGNLTSRSAKIETYRSVLGLKSAIDGRRNAFQQLAFMTRPRVLMSNPARSQLTITVEARSTVSIRRVLLHYRSRGYFRELVMFDDGQHGDGKSGDGIFGIGIPQQPPGSLVEYYFSGETTGGDVNYLPYSAAYGAFRFRVPATKSSVLIHEFLARNDKGIRDKAGERDDWLELFNPTTKAVDLSGSYLTDNTAEPTKWKIPKGTAVPAGGTLLIWADEQPSQGKLHAGFKLSGDGEEIALFAADGKTALDLVEFGPQQKDISTGRLLDRVSPFVTYMSPTPERHNEIRTCGSRRFSAPDRTLHTLELTASGALKGGSQLTLEIQGVPKRRAWLLRVAGMPGATLLPGLRVWSMLGPPVLAGIQPSNDKLVVQMPRLASLRFTLQGISHDGKQFLASNGLEILTCR